MTTTNHFNSIQFIQLNRPRSRYYTSGDYKRLLIGHYTRFLSGSGLGKLVIL